MSLYDYRVSIQIAADDPPFYALVMAAMRRADTDNLEKLKAAWPDVWDELCRRYKAGGGRLPEDDIPPEIKIKLWHESDDDVLPAGWIDYDTHDPPS